MAGDLEILGFRNRLEDPKAALAALQAFARSRGGWAQLLDAGQVVGRDHLLSAYQHARRSMDRGTNATGSIEMEFLLYASGERQISKAIGRIGVKPRRPFVVVLGSGVDAGEVARRFPWARDDRVIAAIPAKLRSVGLSPDTIRSAGRVASDLALERVARVDLNK